MAAPTVFRCDDTSAPGLNGNAGSLLNVLDGCLVSGYGSKTALGWTKPFTATNKAVFRAPAGIQHYLDVDDSGPDATAAGRNARVRAYATMTAVATGTNPYPTTTQAATPIIAKSSTADGTSRAWMLIGDDRTFYLFVAPAVGIPVVPSTISWNGCLAAGEFDSVVASDSYRGCCLFGSATTTAITNSYSLTINATAGTNPISIANAARTYTGTGTAVWIAGLGHALAGMPYPNAPDGGLYLNAFLIAEAGTGTSTTVFSSGAGFRGRFRGIMQHAASASLFNDGDTLTGAGDYTGRNFMVVRNTSSSLLVETTAWPYST